MVDSIMLFKKIVEKILFLTVKHTVLLFESVFVYGILGWIREYDISIKNYNKVLL